MLVALAGAAAVLAVQARLNRDLAAAFVREHSANVALAEANARVEAANEGLEAANAREADRFNLALDAIGCSTARSAKTSSSRRSQVSGPPR